jgi:hypothetical protein
VLTVPRPVWDREGRGRREMGSPRCWSGQSPRVSQQILPEKWQSMVHHKPKTSACCWTGQIGPEAPNVGLTVLTTGKQKHGP